MASRLEGKEKQIAKGQTAQGRPDQRNPRWGADGRQLMGLPAEEETVGKAAPKVSDPMDLCPPGEELHLAHSWGPRSFQGTQNSVQGPV